MELFSKPLFFITQFGLDSNLKKGKKKNQIKIENPFNNLVDFKLARFGPVTLPNNFEQHKTMFILAHLQP